jgi:dTDP-4-amino-4,6-dideoxygalactose transaminase
VHDLPHTVAACSSVVSLPCYPGLSQDQQTRVIEAICDFYSTSGS